MAWRLSRLETITSGKTTAKKSFADGIQDAINDLFNGAYSVKKLLVDAAGDQAATYASGVIAYITGGALRIEGASGDTNQAGQSDTVPTVRKCWWRWQLSSNIYARLYYEGNFISFTINAEWGGATWTHDSGGAAVESLRVEIGAGGFIVRRKAAGSAAWADGTWVAVASIDEVTALILTIGGITAGGDIKGNRYRSSGTTVATGDFGIVGWGVGATVSAVSGDDSSGTVSVTAGTGAGANPTVALTFKDGTWTTAPIANANTVTAGGFVTPIVVGVATTTTTATFCPAFTPTNATVYTIAYRVSGH